MFTFAILAQSFSGFILRASRGVDSGSYIENIQLISGAPFSPAAKTVYIGAAGQLKNLAESSSLPAGSMLLLSGETAGLDFLFADSDYAVLSLRLSPEEICNRATSCYFAFSQWLNRLHILAGQNREVQSLLDEAAERLETPLFLLNSGYRLLASNVDYAFENAHVQRLLSAGYLTTESIDALLQSPVPGKEPEAETFPDFYESLLEPNSYAILSKLKYHSNTFGRLLLFAQSRNRVPALWDYARLLTSVIREQALNHNREQFESDTEFSALIGDLIERKDGGVMCIDTSWQIEEGYWKKDFHFWQDRFQENALLQKNV